MNTVFGKVFLVVVAVIVLLAGCATTGTVPITGRKQKLLVSDEQVLSLSNQQYTEYMQSAKPSVNAANTAMVKRVGQKLAAAVETYLKTNGFASEVQNYSWEFNLVQETQVNAFCMPGGKIVVYEGLLPVTQDESSLAIVLGHEIAHAVAKHSAERISNSLRSNTAVRFLEPCSREPVSAPTGSRLAPRLLALVLRLAARPIRAVRRARPIISDLSSRPWPVMTRRWPLLSGSACRRPREEARRVFSVITLRMPPV